MTNTPLWSDEYLLSLVKSLDDYAFWYWTDKGSLIIDKHRLLRKTCPAIGIYNLPMDSDDKGRPTFTPVFIRGNRIQEVDGPTIQFIMEEFLGLMDEENGGDVGDQVIAKLGFTPDVFEKKGIATLPKKKGIEILRDTAKCAYVLFKKGFVKVAADGKSPLLPYDQLPAGKCIWESNVIDHDYMTCWSPVTSSTSGSPSAVIQSSHLDAKLNRVSVKEKKEETHFYDFLCNLALDEGGEVCDKSLTRIKLALGYLSHRYHFADMRQWVMVVDRHIDSHGESANGGNGKSILIKSLFAFLNPCEIDGREFRKSSRDRFAFSGVSASTDIVYFDDASLDFDLKRLYSKVTGSFEVAVKYRNTFTIPDADAPKVAITSNYAIAGDDPSTQRRNFQIEVSDHYKHQLEEYGLRPADLHGGKLIARKEGGWNANDWNHYYSVICDCISLYLKKGLPAHSEESITFKRSKLCAEMPVENKEELLDYLLSCLNDAAASGEEQIAEVYYKKTRDKFVFSDEVSDRNLWELLKKVGKAFRLIPNNAQKGRLQDQRLTGERKQRWLDAGMEDYRDQNGNNPLDDYDRKVHVFTVSSFQKTQDIVKESKPDFNNGKW